MCVCVCVGVLSSVVIRSDQAWVGGGVPGGIAEGSEQSDGEQVGAAATEEPRSRRGGRMATESFVSGGGKPRKLELEEGARGVRREAPR